MHKDFIGQFVRRCVQGIKYIGANKPPRCRVIVPALQVVHFQFLIVIIATIPERIVSGGSGNSSVGVSDGRFAPRIVRVRGQLGSFFIVNRDNVPLQILLEPGISNSVPINQFTSENYDWNCCRNRRHPFYVRTHIAKRTNPSKANNDAKIIQYFFMVFF